MSRVLALVLAVGCGGEALPDFDAGACEPFEYTDRTSDQRDTCFFVAGDSAGDSLGISDARRIPITHVIIRMQENRSFDHYLGQLPRRGHPDVDGLPADFSNPDTSGAQVTAFHLSATDLEADPPHQWDAMNAQYAGGAMDGFVTTAAVDGSDGHYVMGFYDEEDLPYYYWLARTFAIGDRYFSSSLGGTWSNRNFLYTGSAYGVKNTFDAVISDARTIFDAFDEADLSWAVYVDGTPRQDTLGWRRETAGVRSIGDLFDDLERGTLPQLVFIDTPPGGFADEHPPFDVQVGEQWTREILEAAFDSPLWPSLAIFLNYDTAGGMLEHVPPPGACVPRDDPEDIDFTLLGLRVPFFVVSPWARPGYVSHEVHSHTSVLRFVELVFGIDALTHRDANSDALLDMFDFDCDPDLLHP